MRFTFIFVLCLFSTLAFSQQEQHFTQFMHNKLAINPGYAGAKGFPVLTGIYRKQWIDFDGAPESKLLSFHTGLLNNRVGFGLTAANYTIGVFDSWRGTMAYSYRVPFSEKATLGIGLHAGLKYFDVDFNDPNQVIRDANDLTIQEGQLLDDISADFGFGLYMDVQSFYIGVSVPSITNDIAIRKKANQDDEFVVFKKLSHVYGMVGAAIPAGPRFSVQPELLAKYVKNAPFDLDANLTFVFNNTIATGVSYRIGGVDAGESVDFLLYFKLGNFGLGAAYDFTLSDIKDYNSGTIELVGNYEFKKEAENLANPRIFF